MIPPDSPRRVRQSAQAPPVGPSGSAAVGRNARSYAERMLDSARPCVEALDPTFDVRRTDLVQGQAPDGAVGCVPRHSRIERLGRPLSVRRSREVSIALLGISLDRLLAVFRWLALGNASTDLCGFRAGFRRRPAVDRDSLAVAHRVGDPHVDLPAGADAVASTPRCCLAVGQVSSDMPVARSVLEPTAVQPAHSAAQVINADQRRRLGWEPTRAVHRSAAEREPGGDGPYEDPGSARTRRRLGDQGRPQPAAISARQPLGDHRVTPAVGLRPMPPSSAGPTAGRVWRPRRPAGPLPPLSAWALGGRGLLIRCGRCPLHLEGSTLRFGLDLNEVSKPTASARSLTCVYARFRRVVGG